MRFATWFERVRRPGTEKANALKSATGQSEDVRVMQEESYDSGSLARGPFVSVSTRFRRLMRVWFLLAGLLLALFPTSSAQAEDDVLYPLIFPVQGDHYYSDTFGAPRSGGRKHEGNDIMTYGKKGVPVVAAAAGEVIWISPNQGDCCYLGIRHADGWVTRYIHLNNDSRRADGSYTDDGKGWGIAPGIQRGTRVEAGQLIGWVGDSGNAENTAPHLHFELRRPDGSNYGHGIAVNPYTSLRAALPTPNMKPPCSEDDICDTVAFHYSDGTFKVWEGIEWGGSTFTFVYGRPGDIALSGDWDGDGTATVGLYRQSDGFVYLKNSNSAGWADITFYFGRSGDVPIVGDFDGDGRDTVSVYRPSTGTFYIKNTLEDGWAEQEFVFGRPGDKPFAGDFDGDGVDTIGLHRESTGLVYFRNKLSSGWADAEFVYGRAGDVIVAGDWDGDGTDTVGVYRPSTGMFYLRNENSAGNADYMLFAGSARRVLSIGLDR
ncbi:MAG TPA: M23 family metallopeptidase [Acidimicrobiia bacterium]|nr:M23 family metallopeptidase [Acidimicrobiia bacterium]